VSQRVALDAAVQRLTATVPVPVRVSVGTPALAPAVASTVYAMICEALANAVGHAGAQQAIVAVHRHGPTVQIAVTDDGIGGAKPIMGGGIILIAARAAALGGLLHVDSPPGSGTCLSMELPHHG
jgi:signal transduction histidine kinase